MTATAEKKDAKPKAPPKAKYVSPLALKGKGKPETLRVKDLARVRDTQARVDVDRASEEDDRDGTVDEHRAADFAAAMKAGDKFPPIKVVRIPADDKHKERLVVVDGMHTHRGAELAKVPELDCLVWDGTMAQAMHMAGVLANREHAKNGKPLSNRDKNRSVELAARAYMKSDLPKGEWPSNRELAEEVGVSHQMVNNIDPFGRAKPKEPKQPPPQTPPAEKTLGDAVPPTMGGKPGEARHVAGTLFVDPDNHKACNFEVVRLSTDEVVARYHESRPQAAVSRYCVENTGANHTHYEARPIPNAPEPAKNGGAVGKLFDWAAMESHLGFLVRGHATMGETFGLANHAEFIDIKRCLDKMAAFYQDQRAKLAKKK
jgi:hypothetical protein